MPVLNGIEAVKIKRAEMSFKIIMLTIHNEIEYLLRLLK